MKLSKRRTLVAAPLLFLGLCFATAGAWLPFFGTFLVKSEAPSKADAVVVLAGDYYGLRVEKGGELVRAGFAPTALVSGPAQYYGSNEAELAIAWAEAHGYPRTLYTAVPIKATSTEEEAVTLLEEVRKRGYRRILVVTSNYHTGRAGRIWRRLSGGGIEVHMVAAPDRDVVPERWWTNREARKKLFFEWTKTLTGPLGI